MFGIEYVVGKAEFGCVEGGGFRGNEWKVSEVRIELFWLGWEEEGWISIRFSRDKFPFLNELTLCCLFLQHKATFIHHRVSEALRKCTHTLRHRRSLSLTCSVVSLCHISLVVWNWAVLGRAGILQTQSCLLTHTYIKPCVHGYAYTQQKHRGLGILIWAQKTRPTQEHLYYAAPSCSISRLDLARHMNI